MQTDTQTAHPLKQGRGAVTATQIPSPRGTFAARAYRNTGACSIQGHPHGERFEAYIKTLLFFIVKWLLFVLLQHQEAAVHSQV